MDSRRSLKLPTFDNFLVGADLCVSPKLRAPTRVRPYSSPFIPCSQRDL